VGQPEAREGAYAAKKCTPRLSYLLKKANEERSTLD
jgi:hypothetical protein